MTQKDNQYPKDENLSFKVLIDIKAWQKIQDNFSVITNVCLRTVDPQGKLFTIPSKEPRLCSELIKDSAQKNKICNACLPTFLGGGGVVDKNLSFVCAADFYHFIAPLRINEAKVLGYLILGPVVLVMRKPKEEYRKIADELGVDLENFWDALLEIKVISFQGMQSLVELIKDVTEFNIKLAYQNRMMEKTIRMAPDSVKLNKLLNVLLEVAFQVTGADVGSIMFVEEADDKLAIRAAKGIPEEIVRNLRVGLDEGLSGAAVREKRPFLIDEHIRDSRITGYLKRPNLGTSMILPINVEGKVVGVINLGTLKSSSVKFNIENLQLMNKLLDLAIVALRE